EDLLRAGEDVVAQRHVPFARRALVVEGDLDALLERQLAVVDRRLAGEHPQQRRLAGAVAAGERHAISALELERDPAHERLARDVLADVRCDHDRHVALMLPDPPLSFPPGMKRLRPLLATVVTSCLLLLVLVPAALAGAPDGG